MPFVLRNIPLCEADCQTGVGSADRVVLFHGAVGLTATCTYIGAVQSSWLS